MINAFLQFPELTFGINKNSSEEFLIELQMLRDGSIDYLVIPQISNATQRFVLIFVGNESDSYRKEKNELRLFFSPDAFDYIMYIIKFFIENDFLPTPEFFEFHAIDAGGHDLPKAKTIRTFISNNM